VWPTLGSRKAKEQNRTVVLASFDALTKRHFAVAA